MNWLKDFRKALNLIKNEHCKPRDGYLELEFDIWNDLMYVHINSYVFGEIETKTFTIKKGFRFLDKYYSTALKVAKQYKKDGYVKQEVTEILGIDKDEEK